MLRFVFFLILTVTAAAAASVVAPTSVSAQTASEVPSADVILRPGDLIHIRVWRKPELSGEFAIAADGSIGDPFYGELRVAGLGLVEARERIRNHIARIEADPLVAIEPVFRVVVTGEVRQPNLYPVRYPTTVAQAIALAGGATDLARLDRVQFVRDGAAQTVDLRDPGSPHARAVVLSGDQIVVPRRSTRLRDSLIPISTFASIAGLIATIANR